MDKSEKSYALKKIDAAAVFKTVTILLALPIGLIGLLYCLVTLVAFKYTQFGGAVLGTLFGVLILSPVYGGALALLATVYNFAAAKTGGLKIDLEIEEKNSRPK